MNGTRIAAIVALGVAGTAGAGWASATARQPRAVATGRSGAHDFDFEFGRWRVHHRVKRAAPADTWVAFDGTSDVRPLMGGGANVEDNVFHKAGGDTRGVAVRAYDATTATWAIWWIDGRDPHGPLDPPVRGRFERGVGTFYSDGVVGGRPTRTRFVWSRITGTTARWEQAYSVDDGATWDTNWIMDFRRSR